MIKYLAVVFASCACAVITACGGGGAIEPDTGPGSDYWSVPVAAEGEVPDSILYAYPCRHPDEDLFVVKTDQGLRNIAHLMPVCPEMESHK